MTSRIDDRPGVIEQLHAKYQANVAHATHVAELAARLFLELKSLHRLLPEDRAVLVAAAYLHDIGHFIHKKKHHKHSYHIILHDRLLDEWEEEKRLLIALVALNHRNKPRPLQLDKLTAPQALQVQTLAALLRMADVLDYEHDQQTVIEQVLIDNVNRQVRIQLKGMPLVENEVKLQEKLAWAMELWQVSFILQSGLETVTLKA